MRANLERLGRLMNPAIIVALGLLGVAPQANGGTVSGTVKDSVTSAGLSGVLVKVNQQSGKQATSGTSGTYSIASVTAGTVTLNASKTGYIAQNTGNVVVPSSGTVTAPTILLVKMGTITGKVVNATGGAAVASATVTVTGTSNSATTDTSGGFTLYQPTGTVTLTVTKSGWVTKVTSSLAVTNSQTTSAGNIQLTQNGTLSGTVVNALGGAAISGATVTASPGGATATTNASGAFSFSIAPGAYTLTVTKSGWISRTTSSYTVTANTTTSAGSIALSQSAITGKVVNASGGAAVASATVTVTGTSNSTTTDASGNFALSLAPATVTLTVTKTGWQNTVTGNLTATGGQTTNAGNIQLSQAGTLSGKVVNALGGTAVASATVTASPGGATATTNSTGDFSLTLAAGSYTLAITKSGWITTNSPAYAVTGGQTTSTGNIVLSQSAITGKVVNASGGAAVASATVTITGTSNSTTTDASGNFTLSLAPATVTLTVTKTGWQTKVSGNLTSTGGQTTSAGSIQIAQVGTLSGKVVNALGGTAVASATVTASPGGASATTNASGDFSLSLSAGSFTLAITKSGWITAGTAAYSVTVGQTTAAGSIAMSQSAITGRIVAAAGGAAVTGATVKVTGTSNSTTTDAAGNFSLSLAPATVTLTVTKTGWRNLVSANITATGGQTTNTGSLALTEVATVTGVVKDAATSSGISGAVVTLHGDATATTTTSGTGSFSLGNVPIGTQSLDVSADGYQSQTTSGFGVVSGSNNVGDILLGSSFGTIVGTVVDSTTGFPLVSATVRLSSDPGNATDTDIYGAFQLSNVPVGTQSLSVSRDLYSSFDSTSFSVGGGSPTAAPALALSPLLASLSGHVNLDGTSDPLVGATVLLAGSGATTITGGDGGFTFTNVSPGYELVVVTRDGNRPAATEEIYVDPGAIIESINIGAPPIDAGYQAGVIHGIVRDGAGVPLAGATVTVVGFGTVASGPDGSFQIVVPAGSYVLRAEKAGYLTQLSRRLNGPGYFGSLWQAIHDFVLPLQGATGTLTLTTVEPILRTPGPGEQAFRTRNGLYIVRTPSSGSRSISSFPAGVILDGRFQISSVPAGGSVSRTLEAWPVLPNVTPHWAAAGVVLRARSRTPVSGATVTMSNPGASFSTILATDADGFFSLAGAPLGDYTAVATAGGMPASDSWTFTGSDDSFLGAGFWLRDPAEDGALSVSTPSSGATLPSGRWSVTATASNLAATDYVLNAAIEVSGCSTGPLIPTYAADGRSFSVAFDVSCTSGPHDLIVSAVSPLGAVFSSTIPLIVANTPQIQQLSVSPATVVGGTPAIGTVQLVESAPAGGADVTLSSSRPDAASVQASVKVFESQTTASFQIATTPLIQEASVNITASTAANSVSQSLTVRGTAPAGELSEANSASWAAVATDGAAATVADDSSRAAVGAVSLRLNSSSTAETGWAFPASGSLHWDLSAHRFLTFWLYIPVGSPTLSAGQPIVVVTTTGGAFRYQAASPFISVGSWRRYDVPLGPSESTWGRTAAGSPSLTDVLSLQIRLSSPGPTLTAWLDGVRVSKRLDGDLTEGNAADWATFSADSRSTSVRDSTQGLQTGASSLEFLSSSGSDCGVAYPLDGLAHWSLSETDSLTFWIYALSYLGFEGNQPIVVVKTGTGSYRYVPSGVLVSHGTSRLYQVSLSGGGPWTRTATGSPDLSDTNQIEFHFDPIGVGNTITLDIDGVTVGRELPGLTLAPRSITAGGQSTGTARLGKPAPAGGVALALASSDVAASVPASTVVPEGASAVQFQVATQNVLNDTAVRISWSGNGERAESLLSVTRAPGSLTGTVVSATSGQPVPGATVLLSSSGGTAVTDAGGAFRVTCVAGTYTMSVSKPGWVTGAAGPVTVVAGQAADTGPIALSEFGTLTGAVVSAATGQPVSGASIVPTPSCGTATTNAAGAFSIACAPSTYTAQVSKDRFLSRVIGPYNLTSGGTTSAGTLTLTGFGTLTGTVKRAGDGSPITGAIISSGSNSATSDALGRFALSIAPGTVILTVQKTGMSRVTTGSIAVQSEVTTDLGDILLSDVGTVTGLVTNETTGALVASATVAEVGTSVSTTTNSAGRFVLAGVSAPSTSLRVSATGFATATRTVAPVSGQTTDVGVIALAPFGSVTGVVKSGGMFLSGVSVSAAGGGTANTSTAGEYAVQAPPGDVTLSFSRGGFRSEQITVHVVSGQTTNAPTVLMSALVTVRGRAIDPAGNPVAGATYQSLSMPEYQCVTSETGDFSFSVSEGKHDMKWSKAGYRPKLDLAKLISRPTWSTYLDLGNVRLTPGPGTDLGGSVRTQFTLQQAGSPWQISWLSVEQGAVLTIEEGVTARFENGATLSVKGVLSAAGTPENPILLAGLENSPSGTLWGASFEATSAPTVAWARIESARTYLMGGTVRLSHVTATQSSDSAFVLWNLTGPVLRNGDLSGNPTGASCSGWATSKVDFRLNYWGASDGPSESGPGTGSAAGPCVDFEPWLMSAPGSGHEFTSGSIRNATFSPADGTWAHLLFSTNASGAWSVSVLDGSSTIIRSFSGTGPAGVVDWDGKDGGGNSVPDGQYYFEASSSSAGSAAPHLKGRIWKTASRGLTVDGLTATPALFSPNGDGVSDTTSFSASVTYPDATWSLAVNSPGGTTVRSFSGTGAVSATWDGRDSGGALVSDGVYTVVVTATNDLASATQSVQVEVDASAPTATITDPLQGLISNLYRSGSTTVDVSGAVTDAHLTSWALDVGVGSAPTSWTALASGTSSVNSGPLGTWVEGDSPNGDYTLRLRAVDAAGNSTTTVRLFTLANIRVTQSASSLSVAAGGTVTLSSILPMPVSETIEIHDESNALVRRLVTSAARGAGNFSDLWDGKGDAGARVRDGQYRWVAAFTDGSHSMMIDLSAEMQTGYQLSAHPGYLEWDPFNNKPLTFTHNFDSPGRIGMVFTTGNWLWFWSCDAPNFCKWIDEVQPAGSQAFEWAGVDDRGAYRPDIRGVYVFSNRVELSKNCIVVYGGRPKVSGVRVTPAFFEPERGPQQVSFQLAAPADESLSATIRFLNQESLSVLRTVTLTGIQPGTVAASWDGRADNGLPLAPGAYTVTVQVTDTHGHAVEGQILTTVEY